jgi:hypothetical protein
MTARPRFGGIGAGRIGPVHAETLAFTQAVLENKPIPVTGADSRVPAVMALAAGRSREEPRPV